MYLIGRFFISSDNIGNKHNLVDDLSFDEFRKKYNTGRVHIFLEQNPYSWGFRNKKNTPEKRQICKVKILNYPVKDSYETICVRPFENYNGLMEGIFNRIPGLRKQELKVFYKGESSNICIITFSLLFC